MPIDKVLMVTRSRDHEDRRKILQIIYNRHGKMESCARVCGVGKETFRKWCKKYRVETTPEYPKKRPWVKNKTRKSNIDWKGISSYMGYCNVKSCLRYCQKNMTYLQASQMLGVAPVTYGNKLKEVGLR